MTDDDELRDALGHEITAALGERVAVGDSVVDAAVVERRAHEVRTRRRVLAGALTVALAVGIGGVAATRRRATGVRVATSPTAPASTVPAQRIVSFHGVHVAVPDTWPVVDGMHTEQCGSPFTAVATVFIGPQENFRPSCPAPIGTPGFDGVWLYAESRPTDAHPQTLPSGVVVLASKYAPYASRAVWFHGVEITIGLGRDARAILDSVGYTAGVADTPRAGVCARGDSQVMPQPERLTAPLLLDSKTEILEPPRADDRPTVSPAQIWAGTQPYREDYERYRLILARYTSLYPAAPGPNGYQPTIVNRLAWVVYATPRSAAIEGCGRWETDPFDAYTGQALLESSYGQGP